MYRRDPITRTERLVAPGRAQRLQSPAHGCPFCVGHESETPAETGRRPRRDSTPTGADWSARSFPNRFPLTDPHEVVVPTPEHLTRWRDVPLPQLQDALELLVERRSALRGGDRYVHAFINDGASAGASISHVHAQLAVLERGPHTDQLVAGTRDAASCALCSMLQDEQLLIERGNHHALVVHPAPRLTGGLLLLPLDHRHGLMDVHVPEFAELLHRAWLAIEPTVDTNLWLVADEDAGAHWYVELQPRTSSLAGVELATGLYVSAAEPHETAGAMRERLAVPR